VNLRRIAVRVAAGRVDRDLADSWADKMTNNSGKGPYRVLVLVIAEYGNDLIRQMSTPFISEFVRRLQGQSPALAFPLTWIEQRPF